MVDLTLDPVYPITALSKNSQEVKKAAANNIVRVTENGVGAYIFASEQALSDLISRERADAAYEAYLTESIARGVNDIESGLFTTSRADMFAQAENRHSHA